MKKTIVIVVMMFVLALSFAGISEACSHPQHSYCKQTVNNSNSNSNKNCNSNKNYNTNNNKNINKNYTNVGVDVNSYNKNKQKQKQKQKQNQNQNQQQNAFAGAKSNQSQSAKTGDNDVDVSVAGDSDEYLSLSYAAPSTNPALGTESLNVGCILGGVALTDDNQVTKVSRRFEMLKELEEIGADVTMDDYNTVVKDIKIATKQPRFLGILWKTSGKRNIFNLFGLI